MATKENTQNQRWLRPAEAARYLGLAKSTLAKMRVSGEGPCFNQLTKRAVAYDVRQLDSWLESRARTSTSDLGGAP